MGFTLEYATTPLALASLAIISGIGILKLLVTGKNNALNRLVTHYGFIVVIVFGILGNIAYLYSTYQSSEAIVLGNVVDENGRYLSNVLIDTGGHARGMTSDTGDFVLSIPASRARDKYEISAALNGYERTLISVENESRMFVRFVLKETKISASDILKLANNEVTIGHYMGLPELYVPTLIENPGKSLLTLGNFSLTLEAPSGESRHLVHTHYAPIMGTGLEQAIPQVQIKPGEQFSLVNVFVEIDNHIQQLSNQAIKELQTIQKFREEGPKVGSQYLPLTLTEEIQEVMLKNWFWEQGDTMIKLSSNAGGTQYSLIGRISLSESQIYEMKQSREYYGSGYGILFGFELIPVGTAKPGQKLAVKIE